MNLLIVGIPTPSLLALLRSRYPGRLSLYVAECRPYEMEVARAMAALPARDLHACIVTDNMMAALIETVPIRAVWSQYTEKRGDGAVAINGAHLAALLARVHDIPCILAPIPGLPHGEPGRFAGEDITVPGAATWAWEPDVVPLELIDEVVEHG